MLGLFKEEETPLSGLESWKVARSLLIASLNKGIIPHWDEYFLELPVLGSAEDLEFIRKRFLELTEWNFLESILNQAGTEFFLHSPSHSQVLLLSGEKKPVSLPVDEDEWQLWLEIMTIKFRQNWNVENPFVSFYAELFGKKYRMSFIHGSTSPLGVSKLIMRCLSLSPHPLSSFGDTEQIQELITQKKNFIIAGSTGSGKTSLLTSLLSLVDSNEHLVILEDTYEILCQHPHQTRLLSGDSPQTSLKIVPCLFFAALTGSNYLRRNALS